MRSLLKWWIAHPVAMALTVAAMAFAGVTGLRHMPVDIFPRMDVPVVNIITHDPGAAPADMERLISRPVEESLRGIPGVSRVASTSVQGLSQVTAQFTGRTPVGDARQLVQAQIARLAGRLPPGVTPRLENIGTTLHEVCGYILYGGTDTIALRNAVNYDLSSRLMGVDGVSSVEVLGGDRRAWWVQLDPAALVRIGLNVEDVLEALRQHNLSTEAGVIEQSGREILVRGDDRFQTLDDLRRLPVRTGGSSPVLLEAVATLWEGSAPRRYTVHGNGVPAVAIMIRKQPGASTLRVARGVDAALAETGGLLPQGTQIKKFYDQSEIIQQSQREILRNLLIGSILVIGVLYFFLGSIRPTLIVALTIPITFLAALGIMSRLGLGLNVITLTALMLAIGLIVDDAIVAAENIFRHYRTGTDASDAALEGAQEIAPADISGTFTTAAAFLPLVLTTGLAAVFMRPFGLTLTIALLTSLFLSLTWVPMLLGRKIVAPQNKNVPAARRMHRLTTALQAALRVAFRRKILVLSLALLSLGLAGLTVFLGRATVLPPIDEGALLIEYVMPPGTSLKESNRIGETLDRMALSQPEVSCVYRRTGSPGDSYLTEGVNKGELVIKLKPGRKQSAEEIMATLRRACAPQKGVVFLYHQPTQEKLDESFSGMPAVFGVTLYGPDVERLNQISRQVETRMAQDSAVANIVNNTKISIPQFDIQLDDTRLAQAGVAPRVALDCLRAANRGIEGASIAREKEVVGVWVRWGSTPASTQKELAQTPIPTRAGGWIPLSHLADIKTNHVASAITRLNGRREVTLMAEVGGNIPAAVRRLRKSFQALNLPEGYSIDFTGQYKTLIETAKDMIWVVGAAIVLIYFIMLMQFRSWRQPLIILITVPLSLVGALSGLCLTRQGVDVSVGLGLLTLAGIAVNNAIVLIDFTNREVAAGKSVEQALLSAASIRLRPILLTTLTTLAALLPAAIGLTAASQTFQPFAITIIFGLLGCTVATLIVVPTLTAALSHETRGHSPGSKAG